MIQNRKLKIYLGLLISFGLIILLFNKIEFSSVKKVLLDYNYLSLFALLFIFIVGMFLRSLRWQKLISFKSEVSFNSVFKALTIGYMVNNLLPAKLGELARMEYLKQKKGIGRGYLLGTIFMERLIDVLLVIVIFSVSVLFSRTGQEVFQKNITVISLIMALIILLVFMMFRPGFSVRLVSFFPARIRTFLERMIHVFSVAILFTTNRRLFSSISIYSVLIWGLTLFTSYIVLAGLNVTLPFYGYFFLVAVGVLGLVIPSTSGSIGVYHAVATGALVLLGIPSDKALAYAIIAHFFDFFPNLVLGMIMMIAEGFTFHKLVESPSID